MVNANAHRTREDSKHMDSILVVGDGTPSSAQKITGNTEVRELRENQRAARSMILHKGRFTLLLPRSTTATSSSLLSFRPNAIAIPLHRIAFSQRRQSGR